MANKSTKFARIFSARKSIIVVSLLVMLISSILPAVATAAPDTQQTTNTSTTQAVNSVQPTTPTTITQTTVPDSPDSMQTCDQAAGPLSFFLCPLYAMIMKGINWLAGPDDSILVQMLRVPPLQFTKDVGLSRAYGNILAFVNSLFILVFLVIIILSLIKDFSFLENYHLKQTLPRLIAAIILAQFGYLICAALVDIGNILGALAPQTLAAGVLGTNAKLPGLADSIVGLLAFGNAKAVGTGTAVVTNVLFGGGTGIVFILMFLMAIAVLFALLLAFIYMVARNLIIVLLVLAAPLAFLAWVLPGTQSFFFRWGRNLIKLIMMYPLVVIVITTAEILAFLLQHPSLDPNVYTDNRLYLLIGGLIPFIALLMIPKLLKLSGDIMEVTGGAVAGFVAGKVASKGMESGRNAHAGARDRLAQSKFGQENRFGRAMAGGGTMALVSPNNTKSIKRLGEARKRANAEYESAANLGTDDELKAMLGHKDTVARQNAIIGLAKRGKRDIIAEGLQSGQIKPIDMTALKNAKFDSMDSMPDLRSWEFETDPAKGTPGVPNSFYTNLNAGGWAGANGATQQDWTMNRVFNQAKNKYEYVGYSAQKIQRFKASQLESILQDKEVRKKMDETVRQELFNYAQANGGIHGNDHAKAIMNNMTNTGSWS
ncbi:MAG: hypothetical protein U0516_00230 [Candidatus Saccharibacteria bacterium]